MVFECARRLCGVDKPIRRLIRETREKNKGKNRVGVQFIRFPPPREHIDIGKRRLKILDDEPGVDLYVDRSFWEFDLLGILELTGH